MPWPLLGRREGMSKQAAIIALAECISAIEDFGKGVPIRPGATITEGTAWANIRALKERAITGIKIAMRILNEPEPTEETQIHIIEVPRDPSDDTMKKALYQMAGIGIPPHCPRCGNEEIEPGAKFCEICGLPLFVAKS